MNAQARVVDREPLEDLMVAMDVVDTLRHRRGLVERELDADGRRDRLIDRLREIYSAQGIDVTDAVLEEGVRALEEDRFKYEAPKPSFSLRLAKIYVNRARWGKPLLALLLLGALLWSAWFFLVAQPRAEAAAALPLRIESAYSAVSDVAKAPEIQQQAEALREEALMAAERGDTSRAAQVAAQLEVLKGRVGLAYDVRIVSRPNAQSGVWRVPEVNSNARNFYLIVEAVDVAGRVIPIRIESEETQTSKVVNSWGVRVDEKTFEAVAADKSDDGIIQGDVIGRKAIGSLQPDYLVPTSGATITDW